LIRNGGFQGHKALGLNQELLESNKPEFSRRTAMRTDEYIKDRGWRRMPARPACTSILHGPQKEHALGRTSEESHHEKLM
ncbi:unnamed protein product, partial [Leuciscus chuanchicus]